MVLLFVFCFSLILIRSQKILAHDESGGRSFIFGDGYSDINTLSAVRYFYDFGFWDSYLRPMHKYMGIEKKSEALVYTHYPALPDLLVALWAKTIRSTNEVALRFFPILLSFGFFFFIFYFLNTWLDNSRAAFISGAFVVLSNYFIAWSDTLHKHTFEEIGKWIFVHGFLWYYFKKRSFWLLFSLFVFALFLANISFEVIVFISFFVAGMSLCFEKGWKKIFSEMNIVFAASMILGFGLHIYLNSLYLGSWELVYQDIWKAFLERTNQSTDPTIYTMTLTDHLQIPIVYLSRLERFFIIPGFALIFFAFWGMKKIKTENSRNYKIGMVFFVASVSWFFVMKQHAWVHTFTAKQGGIFFAWFIGYGVLEYFQMFKNTWSIQKYKILHALFLFYILAMFLTQQVKDLYWLNGFSRLF